MIVSVSGLLAGIVNVGVHITSVHSGPLEALVR